MPYLCIKIFIKREVSWNVHQTKASLGLGYWNPKDIGVRWSRNGSYGFLRIQVKHSTFFWYIYKMIFWLLVGFPDFLRTQTFQSVKNTDSFVLPPSCSLDSNTLKWLRKTILNPEGWETDLHCSESINVLTQESSAWIDSYQKWPLISLLFLNVLSGAYLICSFNLSAEPLESLWKRWNIVQACSWGCEWCCYAAVN